MTRYRVQGSFLYGPQPDQKAPSRIVSVIWEAQTPTEAAEQVLADYALDFPGARWFSGNPFVCVARRRRSKQQIKQGVQR